MLRECRRPKSITEIHLLVLQLYGSLLGPPPPRGGIRRPWKKQQLDGFCPLLIARAIEPPIGVLHGLQPPRIGAPVTQRSAKPNAPFPVILHKANNDGHYYTVSANFRALL